MNNTYKIYDFYEATYPHSDWTGKIARAKFNELMKLKEQRLEELKSLLLEKGIELDYSEESLQSLNDFICAELNAFRPQLDTSIPSFNRYAVLPYFRSLTIDCTLYLGEMLIKKDPENLQWNVYRSAQKRLLHKFYPSVVAGKNQSIFASSLYFYFVQFLGGFDNDTHGFTNVLDRACKDLKIPREHL